MRKVYAMLLFSPLIVYANGLKEFIVSAKNNNNLSKAMSYNSMAKDEEIRGVQRSYFPTVDIGANYQSIDPKSPFQAGQTTTGFLKAGIDLYDGGKRKYQIRQKDSEREALGYDEQSYKRGVSMSVVESSLPLKTSNQLKNHWKIKEHTFKKSNAV